MQSPSSAAQAQDEARAALARFAILFVAGASPRTASFAAKRMQELYGASVDEADLRSAQMHLLAEATQGILSLLRPQGRKP